MILTTKESASVKIIVNTNEGNSWQAYNKLPNTGAKIIDKDDDTCRKELVL